MASPKMAMPIAQAIAKPVALAKVAAPVATAKPPTPKAAAVAAAAPSPASTAAAAAAAEDGEVEARIIMDMPLTRAYLLVDGSKKLVENGTIEIMQTTTQEGEEVYLMLLGSVKIALNIHVPCLEMAPRNFVFPTDGKTYGIVIADSITDEVLEVFHVLLTDHTSFRAAATPQLLSELPDTPERVTGMANSVAAGLGAGSVVVATGVIKGGKMVGSLFMRGGTYLTQKLRPNEKASVVSDASKARLQKAKFVSGAAVKVSKALVIGAMATTSVMAHQLSEAIKETEIGQKLSSEPDKPNANLDAAKVVGKATIGAVLNVYQAMETAVFGVAHDVSSATVTVVTHKYGEERGAHTKESLGVVENVVVAAHGVNQLGVKSIAKATAIKTGQEVLTTPAEREAEERAKAEATLAAGHSSSSSAARQGLGAALGLPEGMDPLVAMEAMQAMSQLSVASKSVIAHEGAGKRGDQTYVTTASATGATPAKAQAAAQAAANAGAAAAMKH